jgi:hypothetical protein
MTSASTTMKICWLRSGLARSPAGPFNLGASRYRTELPPRRRVFRQLGGSSVSRKHVNVPFAAVRDNQPMPMREDCRHFESRVYDSGETARYCLLGLAPEQPWRCPDGCSHYERSVIDPTYETANLTRPPVEDEPDADPDNIEGVLADAEAIVEHTEPDALRDIEQAEAKSSRPRWWSWRKRQPPDDDDFRLSNR